MRARASWRTIEPTPPAAPTTSSVPVLASFRPKWSKRISQAVIVVRGSAAASAKSRLAGLCPTTFSLTTWNSALLPGRSIRPA
ncbi:hypothetical protein [Asanoa ferruginea]|uniref:hypothetical protein n=1 Tax=Asanoa ferruginea TaxID=53367 RepID=UPI001B86A4B3|nr:hypothetical protein [Asanoa ferruginea]